MKQNKGCDFFDDDFEEEKPASRRRERAEREDITVDDSIFQPVEREDIPVEEPSTSTLREESIPVQEYRSRPPEPKPARNMDEYQERIVYEPAPVKEPAPPIREAAREEYAPPMPQRHPESKVVRLRFFWYEDRQAYSSVPYTNMPKRAPQPVREAPRPVQPPIAAAPPMSAYAAPVEQPAVSRGRDSGLQESPYIVNPIATTDSRALNQLLEIEKDAYGEDGMNKWDIVPFIRYGRVFGLMDGRSILGAVYFMRDWEAPDRAYLVNVALRRDLRGKDVGTYLLKDAFTQLKREGVKRVELTVDPSNKYAISIYEEQMGFYENGRRRNEYGDGEDRLIMDTDLKRY